MISKDMVRFMSVALPGDIISVRTEGWIGAHVRWVTESEINHSALYLGNGLAIESTLGHGVRIIPVSAYVDDSVCSVRLSRLVGSVDFNEVIEYSYNFYGMKYNLVGQLGIFVKYMVKKVGLGGLITFWGKNKVEGEGMWCSEFIGELFSPQKVRFSEDDLSYLTPADIYSSRAVRRIYW